MKIPGNKLKLSSGKVVKFSSAKKRANFEKVARAVASAIAGSTDSSRGSGNGMSKKRKPRKPRY